MANIRDYRDYGSSDLDYRKTTFGLGLLEEMRDHNLLL